MDAIEQLIDDLRNGHIDAKRLGDLILLLQRKLDAANKRNEKLSKRLEKLSKRNEELSKCNEELSKHNEELQEQLGGTSSKVDEPFSVRAEEKRQEARGKKKRRRKRAKQPGRRSSAEKIKQAERTEEVFPADVDKSQCKLSHTRVVWRLENGRAVLVAYQIYRGPKNCYGQIAGVLGRSEYGMEIVVEIAHLVYAIGLSFDKVCQVLHFFQDLRMRKSQAEALVRRLARHWEQEFEVLCTLLANALVVHADETSWSVNSVWAFLSEQARVLLFGVPKDGQTLKAVLDPSTFSGIVISDDAAVYAKFSHSQKCWAHLLRKAIKLTLQDASNKEYRRFADRLLQIYRSACRVQRDQRYSEKGRALKASDLDAEVMNLCLPSWPAEVPSEAGPQKDYCLLVNELMRLVFDDQLFPFVTAKAVEQPNGERQEVSGTNNEAERTLRIASQARKTGRTNKTKLGARWRTIVTSVFESLRLYLPSYTLSSVMTEIQRWWQAGSSCFTDLLKTLKLSLPKSSILDQVLRIPDS
jgi:FtsZ-binding cell division protein ZapB